MNTDKIIFKTALTNGLISAATNGLTSWFELNNMEKIPVTLDNISNEEVTVFGSVFPVVLTLCFILGIVNYFTFKNKARKEKLADPENLDKTSFLNIIKLILSRTFSAFGFMMIIAVLWQKYMGVLYISHITASAIVGIAAGLTSMYIGISVSKEIIREK